MTSLPFEVPCSHFYSSLFMTVVEGEDASTAGGKSLAAIPWVATGEKLSWSWAERIQ